MSETLSIPLSLRPAVYVLWAAEDDRPLYVGVTRTSWLHRVAAHQRRDWGDAISRVDVHHFDTYKMARAAEMRLIRELLPHHNVVDGGTAPRTPGEANWPGRWERALRDLPALAARAPGAALSSTCFTDLSLVPPRGDESEYQWAELQEALEGALAS